MKRLVRGVTLIELLVALTIFSLIGVMAYRAVSAAAESRQRLSLESENRRLLMRAMGRVEADLLQMVSRQSSINPAQATLNYTLNELGGVRISFWRLDAVKGARLIGYDFHDNALDLLLWPLEDSTAAPRRERLLSNISNLKWRFVANAGKVWIDTWPPDAQRIAELPRGMRLEFTSAQSGPISRTFALQ